MSDTVLDVLLYLFETYSDQEPPDYKPGPPTRTCSARSC